jgi:hypothetical protein
MITLTPHVLEAAGDLASEGMRLLQLEGDTCIAQRGNGSKAWAKWVLRAGRLEFVRDAAGKIIFEEN